MHAAKHDFDRISDANGQIAIFAGKFLDRSDALGLIAEIDQNSAIGNADDRPFDQFARMKDRLFLFELLKDRTEIDVARILSFVRSGCGRFG